MRLLFLQLLNLLILISVHFIQDGSCSTGGSSQENSDTGAGSVSGSQVAAQTEPGEHTSSGGGTSTSGSSNPAESRIGAASSSTLKRASLLQSYQRAPYTGKFGALSALKDIINRNSPFHAKPLTIGGSSQSGGTLGRFGTYGVSSGGIGYFGPGLSTPHGGGGIFSSSPSLVPTRITAHCVELPHDYNTNTQQHQSAQQQVIQQQHITNQIPDYASGYYQKPHHQQQATKTGTVDKWHHIKGEQPTKIQHHQHTIHHQVEVNGGTKGGTKGGGSSHYPLKEYPQHPVKEYMSSGTNTVINNNHQGGGGGGGSGPEPIVNNPEFPSDFDSGWDKYFTTRDSWADGLVGSSGSINGVAGMTGGGVGMTGDPSVPFSTGGEAVSSTVVSSLPIRVFTAGLGRNKTKKKRPELVVPSVPVREMFGPDCKPKYYCVISKNVEYCNKRYPNCKIHFKH